LTPIGYVEGGAADGRDDDDPEPSIADDGGDDANADDPEDGADNAGRRVSPVFPSGEGDRNALPIQLIGADERRITVSHWADGSSREPFKLYSGNRSARLIASNMMEALRSLWIARRTSLLAAPFDAVMPIKGKFNFDPRAGWTGIDAGYSPKTQGHGVEASPVVEMLAAIGLEHARPRVFVTNDAELRKNLYRKGTYVVWGQSLPPPLARAVLAGAALKVPVRTFNFSIRASGKNKITTFAQEETQR